MSQREQFAPGTPAQGGFIPLSVPEIRGNEWQYIKECLDSNWVSSVGSFVDRFEHMMAEAVGTQYAVATVNGTAALHVALLVAGVQPGDEVLVSSLTFIAPANAIRYVGAWPVFIDAEPTYWQMDPQRVQEFLEDGCRWENGALTNKATGRPVKAILPVHILGHPCDIDPIVALARKYNLPVIEDATESLGARYKGQPTGCLGDVACFSFNGNKIITTGGGGMLVTDNTAWARQARYLTTQAKDDPVEYIHSQVGYNYRLTNVLAAMGCAQLEQLDDFVATKRRIAQTYAEALAGVVGITPMVEAPWAWSTFWLYTILVDGAAYGLDSRRLMGRLKEVGVQARPLWQPVHLSPAHQGAFTVGGSVAAQLNRTGLSLPCSIGLSLEAQQRVIAACAYLV
ncbi:MAG: LegC family aminotransferase [Chloroflexi bacterium]|nr:LegC family aminotransferase [Chloroflexota bacterium]MCI0727416.1 LegC family aminotransferase [Chloroflexota bacterium]